MVRYLIQISYIGSRYRGSQKCMKYLKETVQGVIEEALSTTLCPANNPLTHFASRTDKGVHALINTFHVDLEHRRHGEVYQPHVIKKALNSFLKEHEHEILVLNANVVPDNFHARFDVKWRRYVYRLAVLKPELRVIYPDVKSCEEYLPISLLHRCHIVQSNLKINVVKKAVHLYHGDHNFCAFSKNTLRESWRSTKRFIDEIDFYELPALSYSDDSRFSSFTMWEFCVKSSSFLYHQVRKLVGTALAAGFGRLTLSDIETLLKYPTPDKFSQSQLAPACGLYLSNIHYDKDSYYEAVDVGFPARSCECWLAALPQDAASVDALPHRLPAQLQPQDHRAPCRTHTRRHLQATLSTGILQVPRKCSPDRNLHPVVGWK